MKLKWVVRSLSYLIVLLLSLTSGAEAQQPSREKLVETLEKDGCVTLDERKVKICKYDYSSDGNLVEGISFQPLGRDKSPGILLIPGYQGSAKTFMTVGMIIAQQGFACLSIAQPGFGKSQGKPDFVGADTLKVLTTGLRKFERESYVDTKRMGIFGYSRGAMAASLMAVRLGTHIKAAVFGAGIYDFKMAYDEIKIEGIRENMRTETGMTEEAIKQRSSILRMKNLKCPVLILHGEKDENAPTNQALLLRDRLTELRKEFEIKILSDHKHGLLKSDFILLVVDFFSRKFNGESVTKLRLS